MADSSGPQKINTKGSVKCDKPFQLSNEEKAVLVECRRGSIARGLPLAISGIVGLQLLSRTGRLPSFVTRNKILFNIGTFVGFFSMGVNSYKKICFDKIMKLEDSKLADQVREHMKSQNMTLPEKWKAKEPSTPKSNKRPDNILDDGYESFLQGNETKKDYTDQPVAFGSAGALSQTESSKHGRSFDEIREENRRKQMGNSVPQTRQSRPRNKEEQRNNDRDPAPSGKTVLRNKYGDIVYNEK